MPLEHQNLHLLDRDTTSGGKGKPILVEHFKNKKLLEVHLLKSGTGAVIRVIKNYIQHFPAHHHF
jgi:hypothetical protein